MFDFLRFLGYLAVMLCIVPLVGLCVTGSWRQALRYSWAWGRVMLWTVAAAGVVFLVVWQFMPSPH